MAIGIYSLLDEISERSVMFLGEKSFSLMAAFLRGYICALDEHEIEVEGTASFRGFQSWVIMKLQSDQGNIDWSHLILKACEGDEEKAFETFFIYLKEFKDKRESVLMSVQLPLLSTPKTLKVTGPDGRQYREAPDFLVQIVECVGHKGVFVRYLAAGGKLEDEHYYPDLKQACETTERHFRIGRENWKDSRADI